MSTEKGRATKKRITEAATRLIHTKGYTDTSLDDILSESGITKGAFYFHFSGKTELARAVIEQFYASIKRRLEYAAAIEGTGALEKIGAYLGLMASFMEKSGCAGGCLLGNLSLEVSDRDEGLRGVLSDCFTRMTGDIAAIIVEGQKDGEIRADKSPVELSRFVIALLEGGLILARAHKEVAPLLEVNRNAIEFLKRV